jgi:hypothetical protein
MADAILVPIHIWNGTTELTPLLLTHEPTSHMVVISVVGLTDYGAGATLTVQTSPCGSVGTSNFSWIDMKWEDGETVVFTIDDSAELESISQYVRVITDKTVDPEKVIVYLK